MKLLDYGAIYLGFRYREHISAPLWRRIDARHRLRGYRLPERRR